MTNTVNYLSISAFYSVSGGALVNPARTGFQFRLRVSFSEFMLIMEEIRPLMVDFDVDLAFTYTPQGDTEWATFVAEMLPSDPFVEDVAEVLARAWARINDLPRG